MPLPRGKRGGLWTGGAPPLIQDDEGRDGKLDDSDWLRERGMASVREETRHPVHLL